jgi:hypothetical protein
MQKRFWKLSAILGCIAVGTFFLYQFILDQQRITWRDYMKVRDKMTRLEVEAVLGSPQYIDPRPDGGQVVRWVGRNEGEIYIEFSANGEMVRKVFTEMARDYRLSFFPRVRDG